MSDSNTDSGLDGFFYLLAGLTFLGGLGVFIYQVYFYLMHGYRQVMSVLYPFYESWGWATYPTSWIGANKIMDKIPLSLGLILLAIGLVYLASHSEHKARAVHEEALSDPFNIYSNQTIIAYNMLQEGVHEIMDILQIHLDKDYEVALKNITAVLENSDLKAKKGIAIINELIPPSKPVTKDFHELLKSYANTVENILHLLDEFLTHFKVKNHRKILEITKKIEGICGNLDDLGAHVMTSYKNMLNAKYTSVTRKSR